MTTDQNFDRTVGISNESLRSLSHEESVQARRKWISRSHRTETDFQEALIDSRTFRHDCLVKRPRALHYKNIDESIHDVPLVHRSATIISSAEISTREDEEERSTDNLVKQISRLDLFVDLIWVGIVANLSATFSTQAFFESGVGIGTAVAEFILLFIPIWRVWDNLRAFCINFYVDDTLQRKFTVWILVLAVVYGINAPYAFVKDGGNSLTLLVGIYLVARASFLLANGVQAYFIPFLRRQFVIKVCGILFGSIFWILAIFVGYPSKIAFLVLANAVEHPVDIFLASPMADQYITPGWKRNPHIDHFVDRHEGFFIIILGEGVFRLIEGSPSGLGLNEATGTIIIVLVIYYILHWLYFNGDQSKRYIHALRRTWWKPILWQSLHVMLFSSLLILAASTLFLVEHQDVHARLDETSRLSRRAETEDETPTPKAAINAIWSASINLALAIFFMTCIALLNRSMDKPETLVVSSRWLRVAPRFLFIVIVCCLPLAESLTAAAWCGIVMPLLYILFMWEGIAGLERNWTWIERTQQK